MCFPRLAGGVEIEERYPRTNDPREPRRKRLNFVRSSSRSRRNSSASDDYALVRSSFHNARPIRAEMRERHDPRILQQQEQAIRQLHGQNQAIHIPRRHLLALIPKSNIDSVVILISTPSHLASNPSILKKYRRSRPARAHACQLMYNSEAGVPPGGERIGGTTPALPYTRTIGTAIRI
ncbi:MAG: hypothetical protein LQ339_005803 [Xanthoria mediterranea]|nr:MAG: hypothetical protein LQ339_005803 [Xanthoria mediterranea]